jgi:hypothetical protein
LGFKNKNWLYHTKHNVINANDLEWYIERYFNLHHKISSPDIVVDNETYQQILYHFITSIISIYENIRHKLQQYRIKEDNDIKSIDLKLKALKDSDISMEDLITIINLEKDIQTIKNKITEEKISILYDIRDLWNKICDFNTVKKILTGPSNIEYIILAGKLHTDNLNSMFRPFSDNSVVYK